MTAIRRRSLRGIVGASVTLATADDLDGTVDNTQTLDVSGCAGAIIIQLDSGTTGTAGIDVLEESHDAGASWAACDTMLALSANPLTGTIVASAALNGAGVDTGVGGYAFKAGPFQGPTLLRIGRGGSGAGGTAWQTGAPSVIAAAIH